VIPLDQITSKYDIVYADPPWPMTDCGTASARKHYNVMTREEIWSLPVKQIMSKKAALFLWATCSRLDVAMETITRWGLHYRGVAFVWVKTNAAGNVINGKGIPPTFTKPNVELVLVATTIKKGRPFPILSYKMPQVVECRVGAHSAKPGIFRDNIVNLCGDRPRIELFLRGTPSPGWTGWGCPTLTK
jgi:N6-adenosine-specific RNA methylase IME4